MTINNIQNRPLSFTDHRLAYALCHNSGEIIQIFTTKSSALYMLTEYSHGDTIYEVAMIKDKIVAVYNEVV